MYDDYPFAEVNKNVRYTFYIIIALDSDESISELIGYSTNEWVFRKYVEYYSNILKDYSCITTVFENSTFTEFVSKVYSEFDVKIDHAEFIERFDIPLIDGELFMTSNMYDKFNDYYSDFNDFEYKTLPALFEMYEMLLNYFHCNDIIVADEVSSISELVTRIISIYVVLIKRIDIVGDDAVGSWFLSIPSDTKIAITKEANFPMPIEQLGYYELVNEDYQIWYYINIVSDYRGGPPDG